MDHAVVIQFVEAVAGIVIESLALFALGVAVGLMIGQHKDKKS